MSSTGAWRRKRDYEETLKHLSRGKTSNVQHRTPNAEMSKDSRCHSMFGVGCSMLDVRCFPWAQGFQRANCSFRGNLSPLVPRRERERGFRDGGWYPDVPGLLGNGLPECDAAPKR